MQELSGNVGFFQWKLKTYSQFSLVLCQVKISWEESTKTQLEIKSMGQQHKTLGNLRPFFFFSLFQCYDISLRGIYLIIFEWFFFFFWGNRMHKVSAINYWCLARTK